MKNQCSKNKQHNSYLSLAACADLSSTAPAHRPCAAWAVCTSSTMRDQERASVDEIPNMKYWCDEARAHRNTEGAHSEKPSAKTERHEAAFLALEQRRDVVHCVNCSTRRRAVDMASEKNIIQKQTERFLRHCGFLRVAAVLRLTRVVQLGGVGRE